MKHLHCKLFIIGCLKSRRWHLKFTSGCVFWEVSWFGLLLITSWWTNLITSHTLYICWNYKNMNKNSLQCNAMSSVLWCWLWFPHKNDVRFVFTSSCSCLVCVCLRMVVSNTYCIVFLLCFTSSCLPCVASVSGLSIIICPLGVL